MKYHVMRKGTTTYVSMAVYDTPEEAARVAELLNAGQANAKRFAEYEAVEGEREETERWEVKLGIKPSHRTGAKS